MSDKSNPSSTPGLAEIWPLAMAPTLAIDLPVWMQAMTLHRERYGAPAEVLRMEQVKTPGLSARDAGKVLVSVLATGPNFNTNFAALGLPVPVFGRGDSATLHVPGSDALGIVVDAGPAVSGIRVGQAVIIDSWTGSSIRGYESHDGFNAQFVAVEQDRVLAVPDSLANCHPEQLAAMLLTYGTAYRCVVERLAVKPGETMLVMGGGKGTSFPGAQIGKALGARVILVGSNQALGQLLIERGIADAFINRRKLPDQCFGVIGTDESFDQWMQRTAAFRELVFDANKGQPVDKVFEHTGGMNFPLLVSVLAPGGRLAFFGATGGGLKGEYKETFFYDQHRYVMDARWVWMRQKLIHCSNQQPSAIFDEIKLLPGKKGLIWGADDYSLEFCQAALARDAELIVIASYSRESEGISRLVKMGIARESVIDRDKFTLRSDMPDPLTDAGGPNDVYHNEFMLTARSMGKAIWAVFGPRTSPDFIVERPDQSTLHYSTFLLRDHDERNEMPSGYVLIKGNSNLSVYGSHMYRTGQAAEVVNLLASHKLVMEQEDLDVVTLDQLPALQQKMLDGTMTRPKGAALVQAPAAGTSISDYEALYLGRPALVANPAEQRFIDIRISAGVAIITLTRPSALNALSEALISQLGDVVSEIERNHSIGGEPVSAIILRGSGRSFVAGADIEVFIGKTAEQIEQLAFDNMAVFTALENLPIPVISLVDGFALGGGNELAMSTHYRIVTENAQLGQPEVKLGLIPGYGGMQRLPRLIGPARALEMAVNGEPVGPEAALAIGLADEFQSSAIALKRAFQVAREFIDGIRKPVRYDWDTIAAGQQSLVEALLDDVRVKALTESSRPDSQSAGNLMSARSYAARFAIEALKIGYQGSFQAGIDSDAKLFGEIVASPSGQEWSRRFLDKDPEQSTFMTLLTLQ